MPTAPFVRRARLIAGLTLVAVLSLIPAHALAQVAGDYRSKATGNWNATATWERFDGTLWVAAVATPTSADGAITIRSGHVVTISASALSYDQVTVDAGGQVTVAAAITHTLANGAGTDLIVNGTWLNLGGTWTVTGATWTVGSGGTYIHSTTSSISTPIGVATLDAASNFIYRGSSTLTPAVSFANRTYGNLTLESTSGAWTAAASGTTPLTVNGDFTIGTGVTYSTVQTGIMTFAGNFTNNGTLTNSTGTQIFTFTGAGKTIGGASSSAFETFNVNTGASITVNTAASIAATFAGTVDGTLGVAATLTNSGTLTVNGTLRFDAGGSVSAAPVYGASSTLAYNKAAGATVSGEWGAGSTAGAAVPQNVTVQQGTLTTPTSARTVPGNLTMSGGALALGTGGDLTVAGTLALGASMVTTGASKVILPATGSLTRTSGYIFGNLQKNVATGTTVDRTFEVGDATNYTPASISFASVTGAGNLVGSTAVPGTLPGAANLSATQFVNRSWTLTNSGVVFTTYDATLKFVAGDILGSGDPNKFFVAKNTSGTFTRPNPGTRTATSTQATGMNTLSDFYVGETSFNITASAGANGSISPSGVISVPGATGQAFTITPNTNYHVADVLVDGVSQGALTSFTFTNVTANHTFSASFAIDTYTLTASAGANGSVAPNGATSVNATASQAYTITPNSGYVVQDVLVDGVSVGAPTTYSFTNVLANHTLSASFTPDPNSVVGAGSSGTYVTTVNPSLPVPITLTRGVTTPMLGYSVTFSLSGLTTTTGAITEGGFLAASGSTTSFQVTDNGGGIFTVDGVTLGTPCGSSATSGTLFTVGAGSSSLTGPGTLTITSVALRDCSNATLASSVGTAATVNVDRSTPAVAVTSPNGSESWLEGSVHAITWTATDPEGIAANGLTLEYSVDNGSTWLPVASALANSGTFNWTVPNNPSTTALVRASALDVNANPGSDASDATFTTQGSTTTSLASSPNPSVTGESVALTATVAPAAASGSVEFFDGATSLGTASLSGGTASVNTSSLSMGSHSLTAVYAGSALHAGSTSAAYSHTVNRASTTTSLSSAPNPSLAGESIALMATVAVVAPGAGGPGGSVEFFDGATSLGTASLSGGSATLNTASLAVGAHSLTAVYAGSVNYSSSTSAAQAQTVNQASTTTAVTSAANPSVAGESVAITASVAVGLPGSGTATGSVEYFDGATSLGTSSLSGGSAVLNTSSLALGAHSLTAVYAGDVSNTGSTSAAHSHTVNQAATATSLTSAPNPTLFGQSTTLTASLAVTPPGAGSPGGSAEFFDGATSLGTSPVVAGSASLATSALAVGSHSLTAVYSGDVSFSGSTSAAHTHTVNNAATTTSLTSSPNPSVAGESVALTAGVSPAAATGSVEFFDGATSLGTASLSAGSATLNTSSLSVGTHSLTAVYAGDLTYAASTSSAHSHTVNQGSTAISVTSTPNPSAFGQSVSISASLTIDAPGAGTTSGTVEFFDGATSLGTASVVAGAASVNSSSLAVGSHNLTAVYSGAANFSGSTSAVHSHAVNQAATATSLTSTPNPSSFGQSVALSASVTVTAPGAGSPSGSVEFFEGATSLGTSPLVTGSASLNTSGLSIGSHNLTAVYSGGVSFSGGTSAVHSHTVNTAATTTSVVSSLNPSTYGSSVTFTATVAPAAATGSVEFFDGATSLGTSPLAAGTAAFSTSVFVAGSHPITAVYSGDTQYGSSTSSVFTQVVNAAGTTVSLVAAPSPGVSLGPQTLTATVVPAAATGSVEYFGGVTSLGSSPVSGGTAVLVTSSLSVGVHSLTAHYSGDANHSAATSSAVSLEIQAKIVATAGPNGSITPLGTVFVSLSSTPSFTFAADPGYHVASVTVDGVAAPLTSPYTFAPVSANHTIDVQFVVNPPVAAITTLASSQVRTGNGSSGTTGITLTWTPVPAGSTVEVWRKGYGNYPEYNGGASPGSVPSPPASYPPAGWTLTTVASPGGTDAPATRDLWYYVAYVRDIHGTRSPVSNQTSGALDYHLGDVSDGTTPGTGDNRVTTSDVSVLGMHYGLGGVAVAPYNYLDVGPTTDLSVTARPMTDDRIGFEDLVMFAINFYPVASAPQAHAQPAAAAADVVTLSAPTHAAAGQDIVANVLFAGTGRTQAMSVQLAWDPAVVEPVSYRAGDTVLDQGGVVFSAEPGSVDGASFAGQGHGLVGEGEFATLHFRVVTPGDPQFGLAKVDARDRNNQSLPVSSGVLAVAPKTFVTAFAPAMPNPFAHTTQFQFSLASAGRAELEVFSVSGRRVRTLSSGVREAGEYRLQWNGSDDSGRLLAAGVYYARLVTAHGKFTRVVTYLR